jgi:hypothetical protein
LIRKIVNGNGRRPQPVTVIQALVVFVVLGGTLWLGLEKVLASEAVASIYTAALGYVFTAGVQERASRQAVETAAETAEASRRARRE